MSPEPHQRRTAVGIDLGTTNSLVAAVRHSSPEVLADEHGRCLLPSVVRYHEGGGRSVGHEAQEQAAVDPLNTIISVKRLMGRGVDDARALKTPYVLVDAPGMVRLHTRAGDLSPVEVSAEILRVLRQRAEDALGTELVGAVITVPAYFDDAQRQATKDAARLAGLETLRLLNEPTAAAVAYGLDQGALGTYVVYDLGGGTFDVSILKLTQGVFSVVATGGDSALGGDDFDRSIVDWALLETGMVEAGEVGAQGALGAAIAAQRLGAADIRRLMVEGRRAKEALTQMDVTEFGVQLSDQSRVRLPLSRDRFEQVSRPLLDRTLRATRRALRDADLEVDQIDGVVLVGGSTRMPQVRSALAGLFGQEPLSNLDPDQVVALGAAIQANQLAGNRGVDGDFTLLDVIPLSLGIETLGGLVERLVVRNSTIPVARAQEFTTSKDGQGAIAIHVVQGERELVADCRSLARFELRGIPPMPAGAARVRVTFQVDADGLLTVSACELTSGVVASIDVRPSYGLADQDIATMLRASIDHARDDMARRALREQQVEAERLLEATRSALAVDGALLGPEERHAIEEMLRRLQEAATGMDATTIRGLVSELARGTESFAARRMDRAIAKALTGRRIDDVQP